MARTISYSLLIAVAILFSSFKPAPAEYSATMSGWEVDLKKAIELSNSSGKPIMANFTGSDWCGWCIRLKNEVFTKDKFNEWAKENVILLELDFPRRMVIPDNIKQQNSQLSQAFGVTGYPTIWVFEAKADSTGKTQLNGLTKSGYVTGGPAGWIKDMDAKLEAIKK
jgi:thiol-disulfide isomerase/thioredoxin